MRCGPHNTTVIIYLPNCTEVAYSPFLMWTSQLDSAFVANVPNFVFISESFKKLEMSDLLN